jgi:hypothetical protein
LTGGDVEKAVVARTIEMPRFRTWDDWARQVSALLTVSDEAVFFEAEKDAGLVLAWVVKDPRPSDWDRVSLCDLDKRIGALASEQASIHEPELTGHESETRQQ